MKLSLTIAAMLVACEGPAPEPGWGIAAVTSNLVLLQGADDQLIAFDPRAHRTLWTLAPDRQSTSRGSCRPILARNRTLYISFASRVASVDPRTGAVRWEHAAGTRRVCPAGSPDSGLVLAETRGGEETEVAKIGPDGEVQWRYEIPPNAGRLTDDIQVGPDSGDVLLRTTTRLISLSPDGSLNSESLLEGRFAPPR